MLPSEDLRSVVVFSVQHAHESQACGTIEFTRVEEDRRGLHLAFARVTGNVSTRGSLEQGAGVLDGIWADAAAQCPCGDAIKHRPHVAQSADEYTKKSIIYING